MSRLDRLAEPGHQELRALLRTERQQHFRRLVPVVHRKREGTPVHRKESTSAQELEGFERVDRSKVNVAPRRVMGAHLQHDEVERAEALADRCILGRQAGVAAEKHRVLRGANDHR